MPMPIASLETIEDFLAEKRIALIGTSRDPKDFSAALFEEVHKRGVRFLAERDRRRAHGSPLPPARHIQTLRMPACTQSETTASVTSAGVMISTVSTGGWTSWMWAKQRSPITATALGLTGMTRNRVCAPPQRAPH